MRTPREIIGGLIPQEGIIKSLDEDDAQVIMDALEEAGWIIVQTIEQKTWEDGALTRVKRAIESASLSEDGAQPLSFYLSVGIDHVRYQDLYPRLIEAAAKAAIIAAGPQQK